MNSYALLVLLTALGLTGYSTYEVNKLPSKVPNELLYIYGVAAASTLLLAKSDIVKNENGRGGGVGYIASATLLFGSASYLGARGILKLDVKKALISSIVLGGALALYANNKNNPNKK